MSVLSIHNNVNTFFLDKLERKSTLFLRQTFINLQYRQPGLGSKSKPLPRFPKCESSMPGEIQSNQGKEWEKKEKWECLCSTGTVQANNDRRPNKHLSQRIKLQSMSDRYYSGVFHRNLGKCWETGEGNASLKEQLKLNSLCKDSFEENNEGSVLC